MEISVAGSAVALQRCMSLAGWEIHFVDLDLTADRPSADIRIMRSDGRWLHARVDKLGRATIERHQRERRLAMSSATKGRCPLSPQVDDIFLGRSSYSGARSMLRDLTTYIVANAMGPVALSDVRAAWAAVMSAPLQIAGPQSQPAA